MLRRTIESLETERARDKANINRLQQEVDKLRIVSPKIKMSALSFGTSANALVVYLLCVAIFSKYFNTYSEYGFFLKCAAKVWKTNTVLCLRRMDLVLIRKPYMGK